jgi:hypothetical protein
MNRFRAGLIALLALLGGCAAPAPHEAAVNLALFAPAASAPDSRHPGRVAMLMPPQVQGTVYLGEKLIGYPSDSRQLRIPSGRIVEQAALTALGDALPGQVEQVSAPPASSDGFKATLVIDAVRFEYHERVQMVLPLLIPVVGTLIVISEVDTRLAFDLRLLDAQGHTVLTRTYDGGREIWKAPPETFEWSADGIVRLAHEAAWRLAQQAVRDLRDWLEAERIRPREL